MPLSDREQQILKEIEKDLLAGDPQLGQTESPPERGRDQIKLGVLAFVVGVVLLALFFLTSVILLGVAAFGAMVGGLVLIAGGVREAAARGIRDLSNGGSHELFGRWEQRLRGRRDRS